MEAAEVAVNFVPLTYYREAGQGRNAALSLQGQEREKELSRAVRREKPTVVKIISVACRQPLFVAPFHSFC